MPGTPNEIDRELTSWENADVLHSYRDLRDRKRRMQIDIQVMDAELAALKRQISVRGIADRITEE